MYGFTLLTSLFIGGLIIADVLASKIIMIGSLTVSAGVLAYSITFTCTDILGEVFGKEKTRKVVMAGFITKVLVLVLMQIYLLSMKIDFLSNMHTDCLEITVSKEIFNFPIHV